MSRYKMTCTANNFIDLIILDSEFKYSSWLLFSFSQTYSFWYHTLAIYRVAEKNVLACLVYNFKKNHFDFEILD